MKLLDLLKNTAIYLLTAARLEWLPSYVVHLTYGPKQLMHYHSNRKREWSAPLSAILVDNPSSISDSAAYLTACNLALNSEEAFSRFKSEKSYKEILEHTGYRFGSDYLRVLRERAFEIPRDFIFQQSRIGDPETFSFEGLGEISPSALRYLKVGSDLDMFFPDWKSRKIIEVGVGYGGQLCALKELGHNGEYVGVDLKQVSILARKYATASGFESGYNFLGFEEPLPSSTGHLFLSNYAFSELAPEHQAFYVDKYICTSSSGYVSWNRLAELSLGGMTAEELRRIVKGQIVNEEPLTHPGNCLVIWG